MRGIHISCVCMLWVCMFRRQAAGRRMRGRRRGHADLDEVVQLRREGRNLLACQSRGLLTDEGEPLLAEERLRDQALLVSQVRRCVHDARKDSVSDTQLDGESKNFCKCEFEIHRSQTFEKRTANFLKASRRRNISVEARCQDARFPLTPVAAWSPPRQIWWLAQVAPLPRTVWDDERAPASAGTRSCHVSTSNGATRAIS